MSLSKISSGEVQVINKRPQKAQAISTEFFSEELVKLIHTHSNAIIVPPEFILWPLRGGSWARNFKSYIANMDKTVTEFIQPAFVYEMLNLVLDANGLSDRQLFNFPPERELFLDDLEVPMPPDTPDLLQTFLAVYHNHRNHQIYTLNGDAYANHRLTHKLVQDKPLQE